MNFDFILSQDQEALRRTLVYFHTQCPTNEMWSIKQYRHVVQLLRQRPDSSSEFIKGWVEELRTHSFYD